MTTRSSTCIRNSIRGRANPMEGEELSQAPVTEADAAATEQEVRTLLFCYIDLIAFINKPDQGVEQCLGEALGLPLKMVHHICSTLTLLKGTETLAGSGTHLDHLSVSTLCRAAWESSILFSYVAAPGESKEERRLRVDTWKHASVVRRLELEGITDNEEALRDATLARQQIESELENNPAFTSKSEAERKRLLHKDKWRPSWAKLADAAGISPRYGKDHYSYLSERAHPGYSSLLSLVEPTDDKGDLHYRIIALGLMCGAVATAIKVLLDAERRLQDRRSSHPEWYAIYDAWLQAITNPPPV
jgi:hypothetical protein